MNDMELYVSCLVMLSSYPHHFVMSLHVVAVAVAAENSVRT